MDYKNITGSVLMHKGVRSVVCETKIGHLKSVELGVRLTSSILYDLQYVAAVYFQKNQTNLNEEEINLNIDSAGNIKSNNKQAENFFDTELSLYDQIKGLEKITKCFKLLGNHSEIPKILKNKKSLDTNLESNYVPEQFKNHLQTVLLYSLQYKDQIEKDRMKNPFIQKLYKKSCVKLYNKENFTFVLYKMYIYEYYAGKKFLGMFISFQKCPFEDQEINKRRFQIYLREEKKSKIWQKWFEETYTVMRQGTQSDLVESEHMCQHVYKKNYLGQYLKINPQDEENIDDMVATSNMAFLDKNNSNYKIVDEESIGYESFLPVSENISDIQPVSENIRDYEDNSKIFFSTRPFTVNDNQKVFTNTLSKLVTTDLQTKNISSINFISKNELDSDTKNQPTDSPQKSSSILISDQQLNQVDTFNEFDIEKKINTDQNKLDSTKIFLTRKKTQKKTKSFDDLNSNDSPRTISDPAVKTKSYYTQDKNWNEFSRFIHVSKTVSYLVHHHAKLKVCKDDWLELHGQNRQDIKDTSKLILKKNLF